MNELELLLEQFIEIKKQEELLATKKEILSSKIRNLLEKEPKMKYEGSKNKASLVEKVTYKYDDEIGIISYLTMKGIKDIYTTQKINTTKLNSELKNKGTLYESIKGYITENKTLALSVSEVK